MDAETLQEHRKNEGCECSHCEFSRTYQNFVEAWDYYINDSFDRESKLVLENQRLKAENEELKKIALSAMALSDCMAEFLPDHPEAIGENWDCLDRRIEKFGKDKLIEHFCKDKQMNSHG